MSAKAEESALPMKEMLKPTGFIAPASVADKTFAEATEGGGGGESLKYHLYAWDYASGTAIAYSEKEVPVAGDVVFLKENMEGGKITNPTQLKLIYHVVSDVDGKITVSEHPEGQTGGYVFNRNEADDYEESITDVRDMVDIATNGFLMSQKGTVFKGINTSVQVTDTKIVRNLVIKAGWSFCKFYTEDESTELLFNQFNTNVDSYRGKSLLMKTIEGVKAYGGYDAYFSDDPANYSKFRLNADAFSVGEEIPLVFYYNDPTGLAIVPTNVVYKVVKIIPYS